MPARLAWAVELTGAHGAARVLEVGCGVGVAAGLVADRLTTGVVVGIDRSATAIARASARNAAHVAAGRARFRQVDLAGYDPGGLRVDVAFAVRVNVFWTGRAEAELRALAAALRPGAAVHLVWDTTGPAQAERITTTVAANLAAAGLVPSVRTGAPPSLVAVTGTRVG